MARHRRDPEAAHPGRLVRPVRIDRLGVDGASLHEEERRRFWRRTCHVFYIPADVSTSCPEQRILQQSVRLPAAAGRRARRGAVPAPLVSCPLLDREDVAEEGRPRRDGLQERIGARLREDAFRGELDTRPPPVLGELRDR